MARPVSSAQIPLAQRSAIEPFYVMEVMREAAEREAAGHDVLHLEVGQPSTPAPEGVLAAASRALASDNIGYTAALGLPELRQRIAGWYQDSYGVQIPPERVIVTTGASGSCVMAFLALWDPGDRVAVLQPGYPCYRNDLITFGIDVVEVAVGADTDYRPTPELLDAALPLDGLVVASPSNPTGTVLDRSQLEATLSWAEANRVRVVVDEIYHGITYDQPAPTALSLSDDVVVFNSFSKYFSMTGWRLGWVVAPDTVVPAFERMVANLSISAPTLSQLAGIAAFDSVDECDRNVARYRRNREILLAGLPPAGLDRIAPPDGAFYIWADVSHLVGTDDTPDAQALCRRWLTEIGVAATPGIDFDRDRGDRFVRFSYAGSEADMIEAVSRLARWQP